MAGSFRVQPETFSVGFRHKLPWIGRFSSRRIVEELFAQADVRFDGARAWDIRVHRDRLFRRILAGNRDATTIATGAMLRICAAVGEPGCRLRGASERRAAGLNPRRPGRHRTAAALPASLRSARSLPGRSSDA